MRWPPHAEASSSVPRSVTGYEVTTAQPPHAVASWRASSRSLPASDPATKSFGTRGERGGRQSSRGIRGERQTRPDSSNAGANSRAVPAESPAAMRNRSPAAGAISGKLRRRSGNLAGSQGSSDRPWPGRSTATVSILSWRAISTGKVAQASTSAPGLCSRSAASCPSPQRNPRSTGPQGRFRSIAWGLGVVRSPTFPIRCACSDGPSRSPARSRLSSA
jgi:hypothetical protein